MALVAEATRVLPRFAGGLIAEFTMGKFTHECFQSLFRVCAVSVALYQVFVANMPSLDARWRNNRTFPCPEADMSTFCE